MKSARFDRILQPPSTSLDLDFLLWSGQSCIKEEPTVPLLELWLSLPIQTQVKYWSTCTRSESGKNEGKRPNQTEISALFLYSSNHVHWVQRQGSSVSCFATSLKTNYHYKGVLHAKAAKNTQQFLLPQNWLNVCWCITEEKEYWAILDIFQQTCHTLYFNSPNERVSFPLISIFPVLASLLPKRLLTPVSCHPPFIQNMPLALYLFTIVPSPLIIPVPILSHVSLLSWLFFDFTHTQCCKSLRK